VNFRPGIRGPWAGELPGRRGRTRSSAARPCGRGRGERRWARPSARPSPLASGHELRKGDCLAGVALIIAFGYAFSWVYAAIGLAVKDPQTAQMAAILPMFILFFASSALVRRAHTP
jgi:hypothetical protein